MFYNLLSGVEFGQGKAESDIKNLHVLLCVTFYYTSAIISEIIIHESVLFKMYVSSVALSMISRLLCSISVLIWLNRTRLLRLTEEVFRLPECCLAFHSRLRFDS